MRSQLARTDKTIIFLHIPKTAGTTLNQIIFRHYHPKQVYQTGLIAQEGVMAFQKMDESARADYKLLKGHMNFGIHRYIPGPYAYFTFLREPIDRTISHFYFIYRNNDHPLYDLIHEKDMDLEQYLNERLDPMLFNAHTRLLSGVWDTIPAGECTKFHLEKAKENLRDHIDVICLTEKFDESLLLLGKAFGWDQLYYKRLNVNQKRPKKKRLPSNFMTAVQQANQLDILLYEYAQHLFDAQIQQMGPGFSAEVNRFRFHNRITEPLAVYYRELRKISVRVYIRERIARYRGQL